jgi:hypothetical protein
MAQNAQRQVYDHFGQNDGFRAIPNLKGLEILGVVPRKSTGFP